MKIGMNLLLWTDLVTEQHDALLEQIKALGFGTKIPHWRETVELA